jgi:hypothetical protein
MVDGGPTVEYNGSMVENIDPAGPEIFGRNTLDTDKLEKIQYNLVPISNLKIGRLFCGRLWLGDQYSLNLQVFMTLVDIEKIILTILPLWTVLPTTKEEFQGYKGIKTYKISIYGMKSIIQVPE